MGRSPSHKKSIANVPKWAKEQADFQKRKYPECRGTFPDCPEEIRQDNVADVCKICPLYNKKV